MSFQFRRVATGGGHWRAVPPPCYGRCPLIKWACVYWHTVLCSFRIEPVIDRFYFSLSAMRRASVYAHFYA